MFKNMLSAKYSAFIKFQCCLVCLNQPVWWHPFFGWPIIRSSFRYYGMHHSHIKQEMLLLERTVPPHQAIIMSYDIYRIWELTSISVSHVASCQITYIQYMWFSLCHFHTSKMSKVVFCTSTQQVFTGKGAAHVPGLKPWLRSRLCDRFDKKGSTVQFFSVSRIFMSQSFPFDVSHGAESLCWLIFLLCMRLEVQRVTIARCVSLLQILSNMIGNLEYQTCINA